MPRKPRIEFKGALYPIINRGNNPQTIFFDRLDYEEFLELPKDCSGTRPLHSLWICFNA